MRAPLGLGRGCGRWEGSWAPASARGRAVLKSLTREPPEGLYFFGPRGLFLFLGLKFASGDFSERAWDFRHTRAKDAAFAREQRAFPWVKRIWGLCRLY